MRRMFVSIVSAALAAAILATPAGAEIKKKDRKALKKWFGDEPVYAKINIPCKTGRHPWGTYKAPVVEVTPEGSNNDAAGSGLSAGWYHAQSTFWAVDPNDALVFDEWDWDGDVVEIELEGHGDADGRDTVIKFMEIGSPEDFKAAFEHAFSRTPLHELHDDWPADIKQAIAERRLVKGMNKRQAFYVTGSPERIDKDEDDGAVEETWYLRQSRGTDVGFWAAVTKETDLPASVTFRDNELVSIGSSVQEELDLDG